MSLSGQSLAMSAPDALAWFDGLEPCDESTLRGLWKGQEVRTGHKLDGALANVSWFGKRFDSAQDVHPLVVADIFGNPYPLDPYVVPMTMITSPIPTPGVVKALAPALMTALRPAVAARSHGAHLETIDYRGVRTAAMVYNRRPLVDVFRRIDRNTVLGVMDHESMTHPYFFVLHRDSTPHHA